MGFFTYQNPPALQPDIIGALNAVRKAHKLNSLELDSGLMVQAQNHSVDMARELRLNHDGFARRIAAVHPNTLASEDVEYNMYLMPATIVNQWMMSEGHKRNILSHANRVGVGIAHGRDG